LAIATYSDLKTAVANFSHREDLTSVIPDFITVAHSEINRDLRDHPRMQKRDPLFSVGSEYVALPDDFSELRAIYLNGSPRSELSIQYDNWVSGSSSAKPRYVTVVGSQGAQDREMLRLGPPPDGSYTATLEYIAKLPALSASNDHNWVLDLHPGAYLYGSLVQLSAYIKDADAAQGYEGLYQKAIAGILRAAHRTRALGPPLRTQPA
jgi:hypothetical protein